MSVKTAATLGVAIILGMALLAILEVLPNRTMAWIFPMLSLGSMLHMNALRRNQASATDTGCGC